MARRDMEAFRVSPAEKRELALLARARGVTKSELLRQLVREAAEEEVSSGNGNRSRREGGGS